MVTDLIPPAISHPSREAFVSLHFADGLNQNSPMGRGKFCLQVGRGGPIIMAVDRLYPPLVASRLGIFSPRSILRWHTQATMALLWYRI